jgi:methyl-accepting chemotaxis protein
VAAGDLRVRLERPGELHDAFRGMLEHLHEMVVQIRGTSLELASAAAEIHAITSEQERAAAAQSTSVSEVGATIASLASSAAGIADTAKGVLDNAEQSLDTSDLMAAKIAELSRQTTSVGELLDLIQDIAERSDLLALNGSLEATRVGELGRGFAIVAAEMRRLAERVTGTIADVRVRVADIRASGTSTVMVTDDSRKLAQRSADAARQISTVTRQQSRETTAVADAVTEVTKAVIALAGATAQARAASLGLRGRAERLEQLTRQFTLRKSLGKGELPLRGFE